MVEWSAAHPERHEHQREPQMNLYTIGLSGKSAEQFFGSLADAEIHRLVDVRLRNTSQLAGFAKKDDLRFFLRELQGSDYVHCPMLAPTGELLTAYKHHQVTWEEYESQFRALLERRHAVDQLDRVVFEGPTALLCTEATADRCHRRLVAEYLTGIWNGLVVVHL